MPSRVKEALGLAVFYNNVEEVEQMSNTERLLSRINSFCISTSLSSTME